MSWPRVPEEYHYTDHEGNTHSQPSDSRDITTPRTIPSQFQQTPQPNQPAALSYAQTQQSYHATANSPTNYPQTQQQRAPGSYFQSEQQFHQAAANPSAGYVYPPRQVHQPTWGSSTNYAKPPQQLYQPVAGSPASNSQTQPQLSYHDMQKKHQEDQAKFHRSLEQYCRTLQYISPQYDREQSEYHTMQARYHLHLGDQFPIEKLSHQGHAGYHQAQAQFYANSPSQTPQQQAAAHGVLADYHQQTAAYHQRQLDLQQSTQNESSQLSRYPRQQLPYPQTPENEYTLSSGSGSTNPQPQPTFTARINATSNIPGDPDPLDPSYRVESDPRKYFVPGRVFHVLWTEPAGRPGAGTEYTRIQFGEFAYSNIRRFVVIRKTYNACWCLPIHSYGKQAATKHHLKAEDHAVIYTESCPTTLPGEMLTKKPLRVMPESPELKLDPTSRINFGKIYTVEHNIKIKRLGMIADEHMHLLTSYWDEVNNPPPRNATSAQGGSGAMPQTNTFVVPEFSSRTI